MRELKQIIVHCSASDNPRHDNIGEIRNWHLIRGWDDIGYHFFINKDGSIYEGRKLEVWGAHCLGQNKDSVGICLSGEHLFTNEQFVALGILVSTLWHEHGQMPIYPHNKYSETKTCPNFDLALFTK